MPVHTVTSARSETYFEEHGDKLETCQVDFRFPANKFKRRYKALSDKGKQDLSQHIKNASYQLISIDLDTNWAGASMPFYGIPWPALIQPHTMNVSQDLVNQRKFFKIIAPADLLEHHLYNMLILLDNAEKWARCHSWCLMIDLGIVLSIFNFECLRDIQISSRLVTNSFL